MDADLNAHDSSRPFLPGRSYYALADAQRRALGFPRVDPNEHAGDNALMIDAYLSLFEVTHEAHWLDIARRAAESIVDTHGVESGGVTHGRKSEDAGSTLYLADNAAWGWAMVRLYEATRDGAWLDRASRCADILKNQLFDPRSGGFWSSTRDPNAVGVFAERRKPFEANVLAIRFLARLAAARSTGAYRSLIAAALFEVATPEQIKAAVDAAHQLPSKYPGIRRVWTTNLKYQGQEGFKQAIVMEFESEDSLKKYADSAAQQWWYKIYMPVREDSRTHDIGN